MSETRCGGRGRPGWLAGERTGWLLTLVAVLFMAGCAGATRDTAIVAGDITTDAGSSQVGSSAYPRTVAVLPFINSTTDTGAFEIVRRTIFNHFSSKNYRSLHWKDVDQRLKAAGLADPTQYGVATPQELARATGADGLLYGEITHYDRVFAGIYANVKVGVKLRLVKADGVEVWNGAKEITKHEGGISTTPVGLILTVLTAALHVREVNLFRAADELGRDLMPLIPEPARLQTTAAPHIVQVVHDGVGKILKYGDTLQIGMEGDPGHKGYARIKGLGLVQLEEVEPGQYVGKRPIGTGENLADTEVVGVLEDKNSGAMGEWVASLGLLTVDNQPPGPVMDLQAAGRDGEVLLAWGSPADTDLDHFVVEVGPTAQGPFAKLGEIKENSFSHQGAEVLNFAEHHYRVTAVDHVGHVGPPMARMGRALPDARFDAAQPLPQGSLPAQIDGVAALTAANSPYILSGRSVVPETAVLLVEPGVVVEVVDPGVLEIRGEVQVFGETARPVKVSGAEGTLFTTFAVLASKMPVVLRGVEVTGGGIPLVVTDGAPQILAGKILQSSYHALQIQGGKPLIREVEINGSQASGVVVEGQAQPRFEKNRFLNNKPFHIQSASPYELYAEGNTWKPKASSSSILGNVKYK